MSRAGRTDLGELWTWALLQSGRGRSVSIRPSGAIGIWGKAHDDSDVRANSQPPHQITRSSDPEPGDRGHIEANPDEIIGGLPFTIRFETYVDDEEKPAPVENALRALRSDPSQRLEWKIAHEVIHGGHADPEILRAILGCSRPLFYDAAMRGLTFIKSRADFYLQRELSTIAEQSETAEKVNAR